MGFIAIMLIKLLIYNQTKYRHKKSTDIKLELMNLIHPEVQRSV